MFKQPVQEWESAIDGKYLRFKCEHEKGQTYTLTIGGESLAVKGGFLSMMFGFDEPFTYEGREMRLVAAKAGMDVVYDGKLLVAGKPYYPRPAWVWVFVIICVSLVFLAGMLGGFFGFLGAVACIAASRTGLPVFMRILLCAAITVSTWLAVIVAGTTLGTFLS
ncbi:MAG: hypothetical protein FWE26_03405 [Coriobacteriia bacterium]|nr:hypothetical protein [Coriobacteriia bacterium]MCL2870660.1 hypothetical protein [Coriobacteriia bacterium]